MNARGNLFQIGEVAKRSGFSIDTIRYYERLKLLDRPGRSPGGFRLYPREAVDRLRFIQKGQALGLTLNEIRKIMVCSREGLRP